MGWLFRFQLHNLLKHFFVPVYSCAAIHHSLFYNLFLFERTCCGRNKFRARLIALPAWPFLLFSWAIFSSSCWNSFCCFCNSFFSSLLIGSLTAGGLWFVIRYRLRLLLLFLPFLVQPASAFLLFTGFDFFPSGSPFACFAFRFTIRPILHNRRRMILFYVHRSPKWYWPLLKQNNGRGLPVSGCLRICSRPLSRVLNGMDVKVVGRLIEHQEVGLAYDGFCQCHAGFFTTAQYFDLFINIIAAE